MSRSFTHASAQQLKGLQERDLSELRVWGQVSHSYMLCCPQAMARPLRLEFAGAVYHVTSRGDRREVISRAADNREHGLEVLGSVCESFNWVVQV